MWVDWLDDLVEIEEGSYHGKYYYYEYPVTLTRVKIEEEKLPKGVKIENVKYKIIDVFGECDDFEIHEILGGFVFSYIERYPHNADFCNTFPEERHVYQGLYKVLL